MERENLITKITLCKNAAKILPDVLTLLSGDELLKTYDKFTEESGILKTVSDIISDIIERHRLIQTLESVRKLGYNIPNNLNNLPLEGVQQVCRNVTNIIKRKSLIDNLNILKEEGYSTNHDYNELKMEELELLYNNLYKKKLRKYLINNIELMKKYSRCNIPDNYLEMSDDDLIKLNDDNKDTYENEVSNDNQKAIVNYLVSKINKC